MKRTRPLESRAKRALDILAAIPLLLMALPVLLLVGLCVRIAMGAPVLYVESRPGLHRRPFRFLKFRSMSPARYTGEPDSARITRLGRFLRQTSLDELPQLWLVCIGTMSLVGPRPLRMDYLEHFTHQEQGRFSVRPGITGWAQIHGRNRSPWDERLARDVWYVDHWSFRLDLYILAVTAWHVIRSRDVVCDPSSQMLNLNDERRVRATGGAMNSSVIVRRALASDAEAVAILVRQSFCPEDLQLTIYGCKGIVKYLEAEFQVPQALSPSTFLVAEKNRTILGFVEMKDADGGLCLNYIATAPELRNTGIGGRLFDGAILAADPPPGSKITLDVFADNTIARRWYSRLGFEAEREISYWRAEPAAQQRASGVRVWGMAQADVSQRELGFSSFTLGSARASFSVGRLGEHWFRLTDPCFVQNGEAMAALRALDPSRSILLCAPDEEISPAVRESCTLLLRSIRMSRGLPLGAAL